VMTVLLEQPDALSPEQLRERYATLSLHPEFKELTLLATTDTKTVHGRVKLARKILMG